MARQVRFIDGKKVTWNEIDNPVAYENAIHRSIIANAQKTWRKNTERAEEIEAALEAGRYLDGHAFLRYEDGFMGNMASAFDRFGKLTEKQCAAILKGIDARAAKRAQWAAEREANKTISKHIGTIGERREFVLTCLHRVDMDSEFGTMYICIMKDEDGNKVIYKGSKALVGKGDVERIKATIKEHGERDGEKQTIIARPAYI